MLNLSYNYGNTKYMRQSLVKQLTDIGLNEYEAGVYTILAEHSPASAAFIAKTADWSRSTVYTALDRLTAKGLVGTSYRNEIKQFIAEPSSAIADYLAHQSKEHARREQAFEGLKGHLSALRRSNATIPNVIFFEGEDALKRLYMDMLREAPQGSAMSIVRDEFVWGKGWNFVFSDEWDARVRRLRAERDIRMRLLVNDSPKERAHAAFYRSRTHTECRRLHSCLVDRFALYLLGDTLGMLSLEQGNIIGIRVTNRHMVKNVQSLFDGLWAQGKTMGVKKKK